MAIDVNAVGVFYEDRTYDLVRWIGAFDLNTDQPVVTVAIFHVQTPGALPNAVLMTGHGLYSVRHTLKGMQARQADRTPPFHQKKFFERGSATQTTSETSLNPDMVGGGMAALFESMPFSDPNYETLQDDVVTKALELRSAAVPSSGTY